MKEGDWYYSPDHGELCQVIEAQALWGKTICTVWLPVRNKVVRIAADKLLPLSEVSLWNEHRIAYLTAASRIAEALAHNPLEENDGVFLAPIESAVIPLPHQIHALSKALSGNRIRYLLADEVGLGKTIEAGLIMRELKLRGLVKRVLIVAPKGLVSQWVAEMQTHFNEEFQLILSDDINTIKRIFPKNNTVLLKHFMGSDKPVHFDRLPSFNVWQLFDQVIVPMDTVKPVDKRKSWDEGKITEYNRDRFEELITADWDLIIVDEAHRLGGSSEQVARFKLGQGLANAAPYLLLLTATPHQGKTDAFHRLISFLDDRNFPDVESISKERVRPYVIRTEKRHAIDAEGKPLFKPRKTELASIKWMAKHNAQRLLYHAITEYVKEGYNQALLKKQRHIGFLMILMQRLVVSSTRAIRTTLERRLEALSSPREQFNNLPLILNEEWMELDGQDLLETIITTKLKALKNEKQEVKLLLEAAQRCEHQGPDAKAETLLDWIYRLQTEETDPELKILIFTEFIPTQEMLYQYLTDRGFKVVCLNGSLSMEERKEVQERFANEAQILISTDAGGEGLNLQFCHVVINYDIPWNPMRLEQRIGRVDRIGQTHPVRAINFVLEESVEFRVLEVLERKLAIIYKEFGIDKTSDVLDSSQAEQLFDDLYLEALLNPEAVETKVDQIMDELRKQFHLSKETALLLSETEDLNKEEIHRYLSHPFPYWVERMTINYIKAHGGKVSREGNTWELIWPDGEKWQNAVFTSKEVLLNSKATYINLTIDKVRNLVLNIPQFLPNMRIPIVSLTGLSNEITGVWSLWQVSLIINELNQLEELNNRRYLAIFITDDGKTLIPTAKHIWDLLLTNLPQIHGYADFDTSKQWFKRTLQATQMNGKLVYDELLNRHKAFLDTELHKLEYAFMSRKKAIERIGLPQVREHRMKQLKLEEESEKRELQARYDVLPELKPIILLQFETK